VKQPTKTDAIRLIAAQEGYQHSNQHYIDRVRAVFGVEVTSDLVCHSIGARKARVRYVSDEAARLALELLAACSFDLALCRYALAQAAR
jgi:hypothetical protein